MIPELNIASDKKAELSYISGLLLRLAGANDTFTINDSNEPSLQISDRLVIRGAKLMELFDIVSPAREAEYRRDLHGRFDQSLINWETDVPVLNETADLIRRELGITSDKGFKVIFSHDIDWVTGFEPLSIVKSLRVIMEFGRKSWIPISKAFNRKSLVEGYLEMMNIEKAYNINTWNFMLSGPHEYGRYSTRYNINDKYAKKIIDIILDSGNSIGLHGSYKAGEKNSYKEEACRLGRAAGIDIIAHRNHYLRFFPEKFWDQLENAGIEYDFSVGYISNIGFRAGIAQSYNPYNYSTRGKSSIIEIPLIYMDRFGQLENEDVTLGKLKIVLDKVKKYNGCVSLLFHPETFSIDSRWFNFYERVIKLVLEMDADVSGVLPKG